MKRWFLSILAACLVSWYPTSLGENHPENQAESRTDSLSLPFAAKTLSASEAALQGIYGARNIAEMCRYQPTVLWCADYKVYRIALDPEVIKAIDTRVRVNFSYVDDEKDSWRVFSKSVINNQPWVGDCDDLSSTALEMLARTGQPLDRMWLVLVGAQLSSKLNGRLDHLVAIVEDEKGEFWVVGDTMKPAYPLKDMNHRAFSYMNLNDLVWIPADKDDAFANRFNTKSWLTVWLEGLTAPLVEDNTIVPGDTGTTLP